MAKSVNCREHFVDIPGIVEIRWKSHDPEYYAKATDLFDQQEMEEGVKGLSEGFGKKDKQTTIQGYFACIICDCDLKSVQSLKAHCSGSQHIRKALEKRKVILDKQMINNSQIEVLMLDGEEHDKSSASRKEDLEEKSKRMNKIPKDRQSNKILGQKIMKFFISNVANGTTGQELRDIFETYSPVIEAVVIQDECFGFVHIEADMETVYTVLYELNGFKVNGQRIGVAISTKPSKYYEQRIDLAIGTNSSRGRKGSSDCEENPDGCDSSKSNFQVEIETLRKTVQKLQVRAKELQNEKRYCLEEHENLSLDKLREYKNWCLENHRSTKKERCGGSCDEEKVDLNRSYHEKFSWDNVKLEVKCESDSCQVLKRSASEIERRGASCDEEKVDLNRSYHEKFSWDNVKLEVKCESDSCQVLKRSASEIEDERDKNPISKKLCDTYSEYVEMDLDMTLKEEVDEGDFL